MKSHVTFGLLLAALAVIGPARSGHELPVYPSYYPHEIEIKTIAPDAAGSRLLQSKIHAYLGNEPHFSGSVSDLSTVESLGSLVDASHQPAIILCKRGGIRVCGRARYCPKDQFE